VVSTLSDPWVVILPDDTCFSTVITIVDLVFISGGFVAYSAHHAKTENALTWAILGFIAGTNLWATSLMFIRAWYVTFDTIVT
jgi:hypothetical protein